MRIGLKQKLTIAIVSGALVATIATGVATQVGFARSFLDYLNEQGTQRLEAIAPRVAALYERSHSWEYLRANSKAWFQVVGLPGGPGPDTPSSFPAVNPGFPLADIDTSGLALRISLVDEQGQFLIGYPEVSARSPRRAVRVDGKTVGWLYVASPHQLSNAAEQRFQRRQLELTWIIGMASALVAALISLLLSHALLTPIQEIARTARELAAGRLAARARAASRDELGQLAADVNQLAQSLEKNEQARRNLMADVSHEFRTPLAVMRAELEAIEDGVRPPGRDSTRSLLAEVATLNKLVGDIHDLAIADLGALSYRRVNVNVTEILRTCCAAFQSRFERQRLVPELRLPDAPLIVFADEGRLAQLFNNLLENSARHTDAGGAVRVSLDAVADEARLLVEDTAPGVPEDLLPHLFERFFRVDASRRRSTGGNGLGLAISRGIVEAHGGTIVAGHSPLGGLRIEVRLPLARDAGVAP